MNKQVYSNIQGLYSKVIGHGRIVSYDKFSKDINGQYIPQGPGKLELDKFNAIHPQNMARVITRALANESNFFIHRMAFGNGGTIVDVAQNITFRPPRDGLNPGDNAWEARLYNETYSEIVDDSNILIGSGLGTSPTDDPTATEHISGPGVRSVEDLTDGSTISSVIIQVTLNPNEPSSQYLSQLGDDTNTESNFTFDEIGLFTAGAPAVNTAGVQYIDVNGKNINSDTGLDPNVSYQFSIQVNGGVSQVVSVTTPTVGTGNGTDAPLDSITYGDLITVLNLPGSDLSSVGASASITDLIPTQDGGKETYGYLAITSNTSGNSSSISIVDGNLFASLTGFVAINTAINGINSGVRNDPTSPELERERLLAHLCFSPITKTQDRIFTITYTLNVVVARSN